MYYTLTFLHIGITIILKYEQEPHFNFERGTEMANCQKKYFFRKQKSIPLNVPYEGRSGDYCQHQDRSVAQLCEKF